MSKEIKIITAYGIISLTSMGYGRGDARLMPNGTAYNGIPLNAEQVSTMLNHSIMSNDTVKAVNGLMTLWDQPIIPTPAVNPTFRISNRRPRRRPSGN